MYTFNLVPLHSMINDKSNSSMNMQSKLNIELCSIKKLREIIAQTLSLQDHSFGRKAIGLIDRDQSDILFPDIYCQGVQLSDEEKILSDYEIDQEDQLVIVPKMKQTIDSIPSATTSGKLIQR